MPSITAQRIGSSLLTFELAARNRALSFTLISAERNRSQIARPYHTNNGQLQALRPQPQSQQPPARLAPNSPIRPFSTQPSLLQQQAAQTAQTTSSATPPPNSNYRSSSSSPTRPASTASTPASSTNSASQPSPPPSPAPQDLPLTDITSAGLSDAPPPPYSPTSSDPTLDPATSPEAIDWARSFHGLSTQPFSRESADILLAPLDPQDIELKPDGIVYLPEIKYRRILNRAFGPGGWGLAPRSETIVTAKLVTREYALLAHGRLVSVARGEQEYFDREGIPTATEGCKSNALMRCCKDLGVASELWDPRFIRKFMKENGRQLWVEHVVNKRKRQIWVRKGEAVAYPYKESKLT